MTVERRELLEAALEGYRIQRETTAEKMRAILEELGIGGAGATVTVTTREPAVGISLLSAGTRYPSGDKLEVGKRVVPRSRGGKPHKPVAVRAISEEGKARIRAAQKKRWREFRKARNKAA